MEDRDEGLDILAVLLLSPGERHGPPPLGACAPSADVMFGSDQVNWPGVIEPAIQAIESAALLSEKQKREILFDDAAWFLRLTDSEIVALTGRGR